MLAIAALLAAAPVAADGDHLETPAHCNELGTYCIEGAVTATPTVDQIECNGSPPFPDFKCFRVVARSTVFVEFGGSTRLDVTASSSIGALHDTCFVTALEYECMAQDIEHGWIEVDSENCVSNGKGYAHSTVYDDIETQGTMEADCDDPFTPG